MKTVFLLLLSLCSFAAASFLSTQDGKSIHRFDHRGYCESQGKGYNGYSYSYNSQKATIKVKCSGVYEQVVCQLVASKLKGCAGPSGGAASGGAAAPAAAAPAAAAAPPPPAAKAPATYQNTAENGNCGLTQKEAQEMLDLHNKMRCATGSPPIKWNQALACQAQATQDSKKAFKHSHSYDLKISSGENLATGQGMAMAAWMWFTEYTQGDCSQGFSHSCGHYTAMTWKTTTEVGCGIGRSDPDGFGGKGVIRCQYANAAPNFGSFKGFVPDFKGRKADYDKCGLSFAEAKSYATKFKSWGILKPTATYGASLGLYNNEVPKVWFAQSSTMLGAAAIFGVLGLFTFVAGVRRWQGREATPSSYEGLELEPLAASEEGLCAE